MTKIFLDSGNPEDTKGVVKKIRTLDGQTTNPSLIASHPEVLSRTKKGEGLSEEMLLDMYKEIVQEIAEIIPGKSVSVEVYADKDTSAEEMIKQAREMNEWIPDAQIKLPITKSGLEAAETLVKEDIFVNMTLCFTQEQAAAVHAATRGATKKHRGQVYVSPFIGRLDDEGYNGMSLIKNILSMYWPQKSHVKVLAASIRSIDHLMASINLDADILTAPKNILDKWASRGKPMPKENFHYNADNLKNIEYKELNLNNNWQNFNINHYKTSEGLRKFAKDWNDLIES